MIAPWIVEHLNVFEHIPPGGVASGIGLPPDPLAFQELEEAVGDGDIMTVHAPAQGRMERHIKPLLGSKFYRDIVGADVERLMQDIADGNTAADEKPDPSTWC